MDSDSVSQTRLCKSQKMIQSCILCINTTTRIIKIFGRRGRALQIAEILYQHFWFSKLNKSSNYPKQICINCWRKTKLFHQFYKFVQEAHLNAPVESKNEKVESVSMPPECQSKPLDSKCDNEDGNDDDPVENMDLCSENSDDKDVTDINVTDIKDVEITDVTETSHQLDETTEVDEFEMEGKIAEYFRMNCELCSEQLHSLNDVAAHFKNKHNINRGFLKCCNKKFYMRQGIIDHVGWHMNPNIYKCTKCSKTFNEKRRLTAHFVSHHVEEEKLVFKCNLCDSRFSRQHMLNDHVRRVHPPADQIFSCEVCPKTFKTKKVLKNHVQYTHSGKDLKHVCDICAKVMCSKYSLSEHVKVHFETERIQCNRCSAFLKNQATLIRHMKIHTDSQQTCDICFKVKSTRSALLNHKNNVHGAAKHKCIFCDKSFTRLMTLKEHIATHTGESLYTCAYCPKTFKSNANMHKHQKQVHFEQWAANRELKNSFSIVNVTGAAKL